MRPLLGCFVEIGIAGADRNAGADAGFDAGFDSIERAQRLWSFHDPDSELSRLNRRPGRHVLLSRDTLRLLRLALAVQRRSGGAFDCTVGGTLVACGRLPDHGGPAPLPRGDAADIELHADGARLRRPVRVTLDGIAKGFAVDLAVAALRRRGAGGGWVNAGGDLRAFGDVSVPVWRRGVDGPTGETDGYMALGGLRDAAVASSRVADAGTTDGETFPGLLVGSGSRPPVPGVWSVLARSAWRADALAKVAALAAPPERASAVAGLGGRLLKGTPR